MMEQIKGAKYDEGKPRPSLVPVEGIEAIMQTRMYGLQKYGAAEDWRKVPREKWLDALLRHVLHIWDNPLAIDDESSLPALWHVITNAAFLCAAYKDELTEAQKQWATDVLDCIGAEPDMPGLVCTEELCDCFSMQCRNNCTKYLDVRDCKQVEPDGPEEEP